MFEDASGLDEDVVSDFAAYDHAVRADAGVAADLGCPTQLNARFDDCVGADLDVVVDDAGFREENRDALVHQLAAFGHAHVLVDLGQFGAGVAAENLVRVAGFHRDHRFFGLAENGGHVGDVELAVMVVGVELVDIAE